MAIFLPIRSWAWLISLFVTRTHGVSLYDTSTTTKGNPEAAADMPDCGEVKKLILPLSIAAARSQFAFEYTQHRARPLHRILFLWRYRMAEWKPPRMDSRCELSARPLKRAQGRKGNP